MDKNLVAGLHAARLCAADAKAKVDTALEGFRDANIELFEAEESAKANLATCDQAVRDAILVEYWATKEKQIGYGCTVRVSEKPVYDPAQALEWAKINARVYVVPESLDAKGFDKLCKDEAVRPAFVSVEQSVTPTIASDLSGALEL